MRPRHLFAFAIGLAVAIGLAAPTPARADAGTTALIVLGGIVLGGAAAKHFGSHYHYYPARSHRFHCPAEAPRCERLCQYNAQGEYFCYFQ